LEILTESRFASSVEIAFLFLAEPLIRPIDALPGVVDEDHHRAFGQAELGFHLLYPSEPMRVDQLTTRVSAPAEWNGAGNGKYCPYAEAACGGSTRALSPLLAT